MKKVSKLKTKKPQNKFYITTAIPYVNSDPHIGHALEFIQTDAIKRFHELLGKSAFLVTGADENSLKNVQAAEKEGIATKQLCDKYTEKFKEAMGALGLSFDGFMRSSSKEHFTGSQKLWGLCSKDIYKKKYKGLYCVGCEAFYTESELVEGKCPEHKKKPEIVEEENYFFRLSKYQKQLEKLIESDSLKIIPETRKNEVLSFIRSGLEDFSVSRSKERAKGWGVPVPNDDSQIVYVWFDALNIYQTAVGFGFDNKLYKKWWPCDLHVIGKGIIRFHAVYWPAILLSAGLKLPKSLFIHGYITINGEKISKSLGNVINPLSMVEKYGTDQLRYYMIRDIPPFHDGDFSEKGLIERVNEELVSNYSNLFYRVTSFVEKNFGGKIPKGKLSDEEESTQRWFREKIELDFKKSMEEFRLNEALANVMALSTELNRYFQSKKPWVEPKKAGATLYFAANLLKDICILLYPFIPATAEKALKALNCSLDIKAVGEFVLKKGHRIKSEMLFKKVEYKEANIDEEQSNASAEKIHMVNGMIPFEEFKKLDMRVGTIVDVKDHPNADKLYVVQVDLGGEKRQLVVGMKGIYKKEELNGKQVIVICNLEPKDMRGVKSEGMILAADDATLLSPVSKVKNGMKVR